jgi:hypothetical protein
MFFFHFLTTMAKKKKNPRAPASYQRANTAASTSQGNQPPTQPAPPTIPQLSTAANMVIGRILPELQYLPLPDRRATIRSLLKDNRQEERFWILAAQCEKDGGKERVATRSLKKHCASIRIVITCSGCVITRPMQVKSDRQIGHWIGYFYVTCSKSLH